MSEREQPRIDLPHANVTGVIIDAFYEVYRELGYGFSEHVYRRAMVILLRQRGIEVIEECPIVVRFRGVVVGSFFADIVVGKVVLVEVKALNSIEKYAEAQILNYLKAAGGGIGLLLNFGKEATYKRFAMGGDPSNSLPALRAEHE